MKKYEKTKRTYIKELMLEKWRTEQRQRLWDAILLTFADIPEPKKNYWTKRLYRYYCDRFYAMVRTDWLIFMSEMSDEVAFGRYTQAKARRYCCMVRDTAWRMTHDIDEAVIYTNQQTCA